MLSCFFSFFLILTLRLVLVILHFSILLSPFFFEAIFQTTQQISLNIYKFHHLMRYKQHLVKRGAIVKRSIFILTQFFFYDFGYLYTYIYFFSITVSSSSLYRWHENKNVSAICDGIKFNWRHVANERTRAFDIITGNDGGAQSHFHLHWLLILTVRVTALSNLISFFLFCFCFALPSTSNFCFSLHSLCVLLMLIPTQQSDTFSFSAWDKFSFEILLRAKRKMRQRRTNRKKKKTMSKLIIMKR